MAPPKTSQQPVQPLPFEDAGASADPLMVNKPDEPTFKLSLNLNKVEFPFVPAGHSTLVTLRLHNPTASRITFKVRSTSADIFTVWPPVAFANPNELITFSLWHFGADQKQKVDKKHYFEFYHKAASPNARTAPPLWKNGLKDAEGVRRIPVIFLADGTESSANPTPSNTPAAPTPAAITSAAAPATPAPPAPKRKKYSRI